MTESFSGASGGYLVRPGYRKDSRTDPLDPEATNRRARVIARRIAARLNAPKPGFPNGDAEWERTRQGGTPKHSVNPLEGLQFYVPGKFA